MPLSTDRCKCAAHRAANARGSGSGRRFKENDSDALAFTRTERPQAFPRKSTEGHEILERAYRKRRDFDGDAYEAPGRRMGTIEAHAGECHSRLRLRDQYDCMGSVHASQKGPDALLLGQPGDYGVRAPVRNSRANCL